MITTIWCIIPFKTSKARKKLLLPLKNTYVFNYLILLYKENPIIALRLKQNKQIIVSCFFNKIFFVFLNFQNELYRGI